MITRGLRIGPRIFLSVALLVVAGCSYQQSPITGRKTPYGYSWEQELQIGRESDPAIIAEYGLYDDDELAAYVTAVGERVLATSHLRRPETPEQYRIDFTFRVLDSPILNAFALPGGFVYVTRGLLAHMENEAQLAMVLGHEVAHVAARHSSQQAFKNQLSQIGLVGGAVVGEVLAGAGAELLEVGSQASQLILLSYSRGSESESDQLGVEYAARAGYAAGEGAGFFTALKRVSEKAGSRIPSWQSTHPDPGQREVRIREMANAWDSTLVMDEYGRDELLAAIDNIVVGVNPRQGFERVNTFYHPDLAFEFPKPPGWTLYNLTTRVAMTDADRQAVVILTLAQGATPIDAASKWTDDNQVTVQNHGPTTVNGFDAYTLEATFTQDQQPLRLTAHFISYGDLIYQFLGYTHAQRFGSMRSTLVASAMGFKQVTDRAILDIEPDRLDVFTSDRDAVLSDVIGSPPSQFEVEDVAILNQLNLDSPVRRGQRLKRFIQTGG